MAMHVGKVAMEDSKAHSVKDWKEWKKQKKEQQKKWKETKLLKKLKKHQQTENEESPSNTVSTDATVFSTVLTDENQKGRKYTVSIAVPGSILDNAQSPELRTYLVGQIARAATIFCVDEIVVFDEEGKTKTTTEGEFTGIKRSGEACVQMARILQFLECPQYLRKFYFPMHKDLQYAGLLNPLDAPHHLRSDETSLYREGCVANRPVKDGKGSYVDIGLNKEAQIDKQLQAGIRVTVNLLPGEKLKGVVVSPHTPRTVSGIYWGYSVRLADTFESIFTKCPFQNKYDLIIGTSERGKNMDNISLPSFRHLLIVFGGLKGLEASIEADEKLKVDNPNSLFHLYLNTCPLQGSRTIRTEEAILVTLSALRPKILTAQSTES